MCRRKISVSAQGQGGAVGGCAWSVSNNVGTLSHDHLRWTGSPWRSICWIQGCLRNACREKGLLHFRMMPHSIASHTHPFTVPHPQPTAPVTLKLWSPTYCTSLSPRVPPPNPYGMNPALSFIVEWVDQPISSCLADHLPRLHRITRTPTMSTLT